MLWDLVRAHVVGTSFGGMVALKLASIRPATFRTMVVHEPPVYDIIRESLVQSETP